MSDRQLELVCELSCASATLQSLSGTLSLSLSLCRFVSANTNSTYDVKNIIILRNNNGPSNKCSVMNARKAVGCRRHLKNRLKCSVKIH